ncbi:MAG: glycogen debranching enzyme family protein [Planctomycetes bacterium]|nr:glycogen debranching enzyme family protein [Planctomycetota bacterium]
MEQSLLRSGSSNRPSSRHSGGGHLMWTYVAGHESLQNVNWALDREYLLTNGLGGYSSSTLLGCDTRRYHGLLVAAMKPPLDRRLLLSHLDEILFLGDRQHCLSTVEYADGFFPGGYTYLQDFHLDPLPTWRWRVGDVELTKRLVMVHGQNCVLVHYAATGPLDGAKLVLSPFVAMRDFHHLGHEQRDLHAELSGAAIGFRLPIDSGRFLYVHVTDGRAELGPIWYNRVHRRQEALRGQDHLEDLLRVGTLTVDLAATSAVTVTANVSSSQDPVTFIEAREGELERRRELIRMAGPRDLREQALVVAADQFLVERGEGDDRPVSILAGYPWFADWGRDAMIALPGLCIETGRLDLACEVLALFAGLVNEGMLPNRFEDTGDQLSYNSVDSALWFIQAGEALIRETRYRDFLRDTLWPAAVEIIERYSGGTRYNIHADTDGLIVAGDAGTQLTWMDAKCGDTVFTPRYGKAVEINALWVSALHVAAEWAHWLSLPVPDPVRHRKETTEAFRRTFWNESLGCLYDCVNDRGADATIRPNQLFGVSLPHAPIDGKQGRAVVNVVRQKLLTPFGLRSLPPDVPNYHGQYAGGWFDRDRAYHQGTAWAWLLGAYVDALMATADVPSVARHEAQQLIDSALGNLDDGALGSINEIFDGDPPHTPRGCIAQAWSVAEILRVKRAYEL